MEIIDSDAAETPNAMAACIAELLPVLERLNDIAEREIAGEMAITIPMSRIMVLIRIAAEGIHPEYHLREAQRIMEARREES